MNLDDAELEIAALALRRIAQELKAQMDGAGQYVAVHYSAYHACRHVRAKAEMLLARIEQFQKDETEEREDGDTAGS